MDSEVQIMQPMRRLKSFFASVLAQLERLSQPAGFIELHIDYCVAILQVRKIGSSVTTFISADRDRMIENFEDFVSTGRKRVAQ
jgi:hypothetical protein